MKIRQDKLLPGDIILVPRYSSTLIIARVDKLTKSGNTRVSYDPRRDNDVDDWYDFNTENLEFTKKLYIEKPWTDRHQKYFWLLERP